MFGENKKLLQALERIIENQEQIKQEIIHLKVSDTATVASVSKPKTEDKYKEYRNENGLYGKRRFITGKEED